jgi:hypothetical protein
LIFKRPVAIVSIALVGLSGVLLARALWKASRSLHDAELRVAQEGLVPFKTISLDRPIPSGFESISSPAQFRDAVLFGGRVYLGGAPGLFAYDPEGSLVARYRPGLELPPAPIVAMAAGVGSGPNERKLWIATSGEGLLVFDGRKFLQIRPEEEHARRLTAVLPLSSGRVLLATESSGILFWDGGSLARFQPALNDLKVTALAGTEPDVWVGTVDRGVFHWHAGQLDHFGEAEGLPDSRVLSLAVHGDAAYAGTALGVAEFRAGRFSRILASGFFAQALLARDESLTVGTLDEGVLNIHLSTPTQSAPNHRLRQPPGETNIEGVERLVAFEDKTYALARGGLYAQSSRSGGFEKALDLTGGVLADGNISALAVDRGGRLWVGYFDRGLDVLEPGFERAIHIEDEHVFCVNRIVHHPDGGMSAVATANGLVLFDAGGRENRVLGKTEGLIANQVTDVLLAGDSGSPIITVATPAGITTLDASGTSSLYAFHGLVNNHVYTLASQGTRVLAGTLGGLSILDSGIVSANFTTANSLLRHNWITAIARVGDDWFIGTYGAGVEKLDSTGRWSTFANWPSGVEINENAMLSTDRAVYAGTLGKGLATLNRSTGRWSFRTSGLPSLNLTALASGGGYLYLGTDNGLVRVAERELVP